MANTGPEHRHDSSLYSDAGAPEAIFSLVLHHRMELGCEFELHRASLTMGDEHPGTIRCWRCWEQRMVLRPRVYLAKSASRVWGVAHWRLGF